MGSDAESRDGVLHNCGWEGVRWDESGDAKLLFAWDLSYGLENCVGGRIAMDSVLLSLAFAWAKVLGGPYRELPSPLFCRARYRDESGSGVEFVRGDAGADVHCFGLAGADYCQSA